jgi:signal transduction histidine kinase
MTPIGGKGSRTSFRRSLRAQVAVSVALPILLVLVEISVVRYWREDKLLTDQTQLAVAQLGQVVMGSLRQAMLQNNRPMLSNMLGDISATQAFRRVQIIDLNGVTRASTLPAELNQAHSLSEKGCQECHHLPAAAQPATLLLTSEPDTLRVASPIVNEPACAGCHSPQTRLLGMLLVDVPLGGMRTNLFHELQVDLALSVGLTLLVTVGVYLLVQWLIVERVEAFRRPLAEYAAGHFEARLPVARTADEIGELALAFNRMADELQRHAQEEETRSQLRQQAIVEERERIGRELHDGLAQMLGYINTKAMAIRLLLGKQQYAAAEAHLHQLEAASHELFVDVRETILGLQMVKQQDIHLADLLKDYGVRFSQLSEVPVEVVISPEAEDMELPAESELQLLRIVQEALTNIRKHASATWARVSFHKRDGQLELTISDDGQGFELDSTQPGQPRSHFGLNIMRERAEAIGAEFCIETKPKAGACITVRLAAPEK